MLAVDGPRDDPDDPGDDNNDNDDNDDEFLDAAEELDPSLAVFHNLTVTVNHLFHSSCHTNDSSSSHAKVHEPDTFDGTDPKKLWTFLVQCELCFQDHAKAFCQDRARVTLAQSYLKGMTLEWFKPDLLNSGDPADHPHWMDSWVHFIAELQSTFGPHDPVADAKHQLEHLQMKDLYCVMQYIMDFNHLTSQVQDYGDGTLHCLFYSGLLDRLKDEIARVGKPLTLNGLRALCQEIDTCYWEHKDKISHMMKSQPTSSSTTKPSNSGGNTPKSGQAKTSNSPSSTNTSGLSKATSNQSSSSSKLDLTNKLGKDRKLTADKHKQWLDNNLCMFCGGTGHFTDNCAKKSKKAKAHAAAVAAESSKMDSNSGANSKSKKE